jgi:hypothetical protein
MTPRITNPRERAEVLRYINAAVDAWHQQEVTSRTEQDARLARVRAGVLQQLAYDIEVAGTISQ